MKPAGHPVSTQQADELVLLPDPPGSQHLSILPTSDGRPGVRLVGELDVCCTDRLTSSLAGLAERSSSSDPVRVDLADLTFIDVAGARALVAIGRDLAERCGGGLVLESPPQPVLDVLELFVTDRGLRAGQPVELPGPADGRRP